jgi:hypothetical protein
VTMAQWVEEEERSRVVQGVVQLAVVVVVVVGACCRRFAIFAISATVGSPHSGQNSLLRCPVAALAAEEYAPLLPRRSPRGAHPFHVQR